MQGTIRSYTSYTLNAFRQSAGANVDKVTFELGVKVTGEARIPYVTKGTSDANLKITVECSFLKEVEAPEPGSIPRLSRAGIQVSCPRRNPSIIGTKPQTLAWY